MARTDLGPVTAYAEAVAHGYTGTREEFAALIANAAEALGGIENKIDKPAEAPAVGNMLRVKQVNEDGTFVCEWADGGAGGGVTDVQVAGASVVQDGVANVPPANYERPGVIYSSGGGSGIAITSGGRAYILKAPDASIDSRNDENRPIVPKNLVYAVNSVECSSKANEQLTAEQQLAARQRLGAFGKAWEKIFDFTTASATREISFDYSEYGDDNDFFVKITIPKAETAGTISVNYNGNALGTNRSTSVSSETVVAARLSKIGDTKFTEIFGANSLYYQNAANAWAWTYANGNSLIKVTCPADLPSGTNVKIYRH